MFKKSKLSFKNKTIFEKFVPSIEKAFFEVSRMLFFDIINIDGTINVEKAGLLKKNQVWYYIYYLYYYNSTTVEEFARMMNKKNGKANAYHYYQVVRETIDNQFIHEHEIVSIDVNGLIYFVNVICHKYKDNLENPVVDFLNRILKNKEAVSRIKEIKLQTGILPSDIDIENIKFTIKQSE